VGAPVPTGFCGIPILNAQKSWLFAYKASLGDLARDCRNMAGMIFGEPRASDTITETLTALEQEVK